MANKFLMKLISRGAPVVMIGMFAAGIIYILLVYFNVIPE